MELANEEEIFLKIEVHIKAESILPNLSPRRERILQGKEAVQTVMLFASELLSISICKFISM